jgi:hypothetical protein
MNKSEIIEKLNAQGVTFDPAQSKAELAALLGTTEGKPGDGTASNGTGAEPPAAGPPDPDEETPADPEPADAEMKELVAAKVAAGLTFEQALEVISRQREEDAARGVES